MYDMNFVVMDLSMYHPRKCSSVIVNVKCTLE